MLPPISRSNWRCFSPAAPPAPTDGPTYLCTNSNQYTTHIPLLCAQNELNACHLHQAFPSKLYEILEGENPDIIGWTATGRGFEVGFRSCLWGDLALFFQRWFFRWSRGPFACSLPTVYTPASGHIKMYLVRIIISDCCCVARTHTDSHESRSIARRLWHAGMRAVEAVCSVRHARLHTHLVIHVHIYA